MAHPRKFARFWRLSMKLPHALRGFVTIVAFTDQGRMRRFTLQKSFLLLIAFMIVFLTVSSALSFLGLFQSQYHRAKVAYLEGENRSLTSLLEGQAAELGRLKLEVDRLKEFERRLRVISGLDLPQEPVVGMGQGGGQPLPSEEP